MISTYVNENDILHKTADSVLNESTIWIDIVDMSHEEEQLIEDFLGIDIPTRREISQTEISRRLYNENSAFYVTTSLIVDDSETPVIHSVIFILHKHRVITVRYVELRAFIVLANKLSKRSMNCCYTAHDIFLELLRNIVDRVSDVIERINEEVDSYNRTVFAGKQSAKEHVKYKKILERIGKHGDILSKSRESLVSLNRAVHYILKMPEFYQDEQKTAWLNILLTDIVSISDFAQFVSSDLNFVLDATLGMIAIEQNDIIKIFSVIAVLFFPPTLIASIYGMNFKFIPELDYMYGYPMALLLMLLSILITYRFFKRKKWL